MATTPRSGPPPRAREREGLSWIDWSERVQRYLETVVALFSPTLIIVGGGASRKADKWVPHLDVGVDVVPATLENEAGIVGAALVGSLAEPAHLTGRCRSLHFAFVTMSARTCVPRT